MKQIYILLSRTGTIPSKLIHTMTRGDFTHVSISLRPTTDRLYSYARRTINNPLHAGLIVENIHTDVFARYPDCQCSLLELSVSDEAYLKMQRCIRFFMKHYQKATYNFLGVLPLRLGIRWPRRFRLTCSQFVAVVLSSSKEVTLPKDPYLMLPNDFKQIPGIRQIYSGILADCTVPPMLSAIQV